MSNFWDDDWDSEHGDFWKENESSKFLMTDEEIDTMIKEEARQRERRRNQLQLSHDLQDARERAERYENDRKRREKEAYQRERYHRTQEALEREGRTPQIHHRKARVYRIERVSLLQWAVNCNNRITFVGKKRDCQSHIRVNAVLGFDEVQT